MDVGPTVLEAPCDILIPAALEGQIHRRNAPRIKAHLIAEAANGPITYGADQYLQQGGKIIIPDAYLNAGGVTVSYFEWIKNLSHMRFGRMERRYQEIRGQSVIDAIETVIGSPVTSPVRSALASGSGELDLVRSGLEDTMRSAYQQIREIYLTRSEIPDLRTASFSLAIEKISRDYMEMGL